MYERVHLLVSIVLGDVIALLLYATDTHSFMIYFFVIIALVFQMSECDCASVHIP